MNDKNKIEALLFASAKRMTVEEISNITGLRDLDNIRAALTELKNDFEARGASMILNEENGFCNAIIEGISSVFPDSIAVLTLRGVSPYNSGYLL